MGPVCDDLNQRIEPIRDEPALADRFGGPRGQVTLRYLVRVLPGTEWVIKDHFIPAARHELAQQGVELAAEPTFCFINRVETFRKLFNRQLTEEEIIHEVAEEEAAAGRVEGRAEHATGEEESVQEEAEQKKA